MKRIVLFFLLCMLFTGITACGNANSSDFAPDNTIAFSSNEEMLQQLAGMWLVEDNDNDKTYYIFQNNEIYLTRESMYSAQVENVLNDAVRTGGLDAWYKQNFKTVSSAIQLSDIANVQTIVDYYPNKGLVKLNAGASAEASIFITDSGVLCCTSDSPSGTPMTKLSDTADFTTGRFSRLVDAVKYRYTAPRQWLFPSAEAYAKLIKDARPSLDLILVQEEGGTSHYTSSGKLLGAYATLIVSDDSVVFNEGYHKADQNAPFIISYTPNADGGMVKSLTVYDSEDPNYYALLRDYVDPVLEYFPNALSVYDLTSRFLDESTVANGLRELTIYENGITYHITQTTNESMVLITIMVDEYLKMPT